MQKSESHKHINYAPNSLTTDGSILRANEPLPLLPQSGGYPRTVRVVYTYDGSQEDWGDCDAKGVRR